MLGQMVANVVLSAIIAFLICLYREGTIYEFIFFVIFSLYFFKMDYSNMSVFSREEGTWSYFMFADNISRKIKEEEELAAIGSTLNVADIEPLYTQIIQSEPIFFDNVQEYRNIGRFGLQNHGYENDNDDQDEISIQEREQRKLQYQKRVVSIFIKILNKYSQVIKPTEDSEDKCVICLYEFKAGQKLRVLKCNHKFHWDCCNNWMFRGFSCPVCRAKLEPSAMHEFRIFFIRRAMNI